MKTTLNSLLLYILALSISSAEVVDSTSVKWNGDAWKPNQLTLEHWPYQSGIFPLITQGHGQVQLPKLNFVLRLALMHTNAAPCTVAKLWGKIAGTTNSCLAQLIFNGTNYSWQCPVSPTNDSLFDSTATVTLDSPVIQANQWVYLDTLVKPQAYQQTFGWSSGDNLTHDPSIPAKVKFNIARQLSPADWNLDYLEIISSSNFIGRIELLPVNTPANLIPVNIQER
jgi:hypothetical protein